MSWFGNGAMLHVGRSVGTIMFPNSWINAIQLNHSEKWRVVVLNLKWFKWRIFLYFQIIVCIVYDFWSIVSYFVKEVRGHETAILMQYSYYRSYWRIVVVTHRVLCREFPKDCLREQQCNEPLYVVVWCRSNNGSSLLGQKRFQNWQCIHRHYSNSRGPLSSDTLHNNVVFL